jgi:uncharacterized protein (DUF2141 family)
MLSKMATIWKNNHGSTLTVCGLVVAMLMSIAWRYDIFPEIGPPSELGTPLYGRRLPRPTNIVVVAIRSLDTQEGTVILQVVGPPLSEGEALLPIYSRSAKLQDGLAEFVVTDLPRGTYAAFAYLDSDHNDELNLDDSGVPTEPYGFARISGGREPRQLADGVFELINEPVFLKFQLRKPSPPSALDAKSSGIKRQ